MAAAPAFPFRVLRRGLRAASRAGANVVDRVLRREDALEPFTEAPTERPTPSREGIHVRFGATGTRVRRGTTLLEAAMDAGVDLRSYCGGNCSCGTCRVEVVSGARSLSRRGGLEEMVLGMDATRRGDRLACQAQVLGDVELRIPEWF